MDCFVAIGKFIGLFVSLFAFVVVVGGGVGIFFCWLGEKRADREIKKHDAAVRAKMLRKRTPQNGSTP